MPTVNPASLPVPTQSKTTAPNQDAFGKDAFMKLLVEQMKHQSPTDPADGQAWINQMTQFSMLEQMQQQSAEQVRQSGETVAADAMTLVGRAVSWTDASGQSSAGVVESVQFGSNGPTLTIAGQPGISMGSLIEVR